MFRYYPGQLVCHHISGKYIAYAIITPGISQGMVRVMNRNTEERTLIKVGIKIYFLQLWDLRIQAHKLSGVYINMIGKENLRFWGILLYV